MIYAGRKNDLFKNECFLNVQLMLPIIGHWCFQLKAIYGQVAVICCWCHMFCSRMLCIEWEGPWMVWNGKNDYKSAVVLRLSMYNSTSIFATKITPLHKTAPQIQIHTICAHSAQGQRTKGLRYPVPNFRAGRGMSHACHIQFSYGCSILKCLWKEVRSYGCEPTPLLRFYFMWVTGLRNYQV